MGLGRQIELVWYPKHTFWLYAYHVVSHYFAILGKIIVEENDVGFLSDTEQIAVDEIRCWTGNSIALENGHLPVSLIEKGDQEKKEEIEENHGCFREG